MRYLTLGRTGMEVSVVSLGSWLTFGGSVDETTSAACVHRAFDLGVNLFDTANVYAGGRAEEVLGTALASLPRDRFLVATKVFFPMGPDPEDRGLGRAHVLAQCDASLRRLGLDVIDLYQCHRYDPETPLGETCRTMDELVRTGKVRAWGVSEWTAEQMEAAFAICEREGLALPATNQPRYSMLERGIEAEILPACALLGLGVLAFSPLAQGMLTGKYRSASEVPVDSRAADPRAAAFVRRFFTPEDFARVDRLRGVAVDLGVPMPRLALAWVLRRPEISTAIVGATRTAHVEEAVAAADVELGAGAWDRVERALR
ncbi:MAG TPA: aldo/keto reductase family protein [Actinomycetota bacterium]|nr:aldo/keto reductase family protein [Actinomycetota bacterium]